MLQLTKTQAEYVRIANERFGFPGKISRKEMFLLMFEGLTPTMGSWIQTIPELKLERSFYKLPKEGEFEIRENLPRGRKKKPAIVA
jgi:hypothetical protein